MPKFRSFSAAVRYALDNTDIGTKSSVDDLVDLACRQFYNGPGIVSGYQIALSERIKYRIKHGIIEDCRSYETQHRRNMLDDNKMSVSQAKAAINILRRIPRKDLAELLNCCHSIDQLRELTQVKIATIQAYIKAKELAKKIPAFVTIE